MTTTTESAARPVRQRIAARRAPLLGVVGVLGTLAFFEFLAVADVISPRYVPPPTRLVGALLSLGADPGFLSNLLSTLTAWATVLIIVAIVGATLGCAMGIFRPVRRATAGLVELLRPIPSVGLLPAAVLLFGLGTEMKVILGCYAAFWPVLINTVYGVSEVDRVLLDTARTFQWGRLTILRRVVLPSAAPFIATGLRLASAVALIVVLTTELLVARSGLGTIIRLYQEAGRTDFVYAGIVVTGLIGLTSNATLSALERRLLHWTPAHRRTA
jgi:NitT/TauT family transport system permease protein